VVSLGSSSIQVSRLALGSWRGLLAAIGVRR
jgi:hypothetical protein